MSDAKTICMTKTMYVLYSKSSVQESVQLANDIVYGG